MYNPSFARTVVAFNASMMTLRFLLLVAVLQQCSASTDRPWLVGIPTSIPLLSKEFISDDSDLYHFGLPDKNQSLGISTCSCILVSPLDSDLTRPYTPISSRHEKGRFTLLVKRYPHGAMSRIFDNLQVGRDMLSFRQIPFNLKIQYPFENPHCILMLAAGTGITPMYQVRRVYMLHDNLSMVPIFGCPLTNLFYNNNNNNNNINIVGTLANVWTQGTRQISWSCCVIVCVPSRQHVPHG